MAAEMVRRAKLIKFLKNETKAYERISKTFSETIIDDKYQQGILFGYKTMLEAFQSEFNVSNDELDQD